MNLHMILLNGLLGASMMVSAGEIQAVALHREKMSPEVTASSERLVCALQGFDCNHGAGNDKQVGFYTGRLTEGLRYFALSTSKLQLAQLRLRDVGGSLFVVEHMWNFKNYASTAVAKEENSDFYDVEPFIYPALYPLGPNHYAVAFVTGRYTTYIRGGATFQYADFLPLGNNSKFDDVLPIFAAVPFYCDNQPTPGCPASTGSCEDWTGGQSSGYLTMKFLTTKVPGQYDWLATWHASDTPDGRSDRVKTKKSTLTARLVVGDKRSWKGLEKMRVCQ